MQPVRPVHVSLPPQIAVAVPATSKPAHDEPAFALALREAVAKIDRNGAAEQNATNS